MPARASQRGFTYLGLIILVAIIGLVGAASLKIDALLQRAAAEEALLDIGAAFSDALRSYAAATPPGQPQQPPTLQELLKDPRFPNPRRHLRKIFVDPMTGKAEWGIMYLGDKAGVLGVYSLSSAKPLKVGNFDPRFLNMENKEHVSDWKFTMSSQTMAPQPGLNAPGADPKASLFPPADPAAPLPAAPNPKLEAARLEAQRLAAEVAEAERAAQKEAENKSAEQIEAEKKEVEEGGATTEEPKKEVPAEEGDGAAEPKVADPKPA